MARLTHARQGIAWLVVAVACVPGLVLVGVATAFRTSEWSLQPLLAGLMFLALPAAFLLDDPPASAVESAPRSPWWQLSARLLGWIPLAAVIAASGTAWAHGRSVAQSGLLVGLPLAAMVAITAGASLARRFGRNSPGDLVASVAAMILLALLVFQPVWRGFHLLPDIGGATADEVRAWYLLAGGAVLVLLWAPARRPHHAAVDV